jgi:Leucine-rich repeat (LRR) protein
MTVRSARLVSLFSVSWCLLAAATIAQEQKPEDKPAEAAAPLIPDANLEKVVRSYVFEKKNNDMPLTEEDLRTKLFVLHGDGKGIKDLTGLEKCTNLLEIRLAKNEITDVKPLAALENLQSLDLAGNQIKDIAPLAGLKKLQYLQLENNQIEDAAPVAGLEKLFALYLTGNKIKDIAPVAGLGKLASLYLGNNQIENIGPLAEVNRLSTLDLSGNPLADLSPLGKQTQVRILMVENCKISDLSPLVALCEADAGCGRNLAPFLRLYLENNPLSQDAKDKQIPALTAAGVRVDLDRTAKKQ